MKNIIYYFTLFLLVISSDLFSQAKKNLIIEYELKLLLNELTIYNASLCQNDSIGYFKYTNIIKDKELSKKDSTYHFSIRDNSDNLIYFNKNISVEVAKGIGDEPYYQIIDSLKNIKWEITNEVKRINKFETIKAITKFKGRIYTVWFTPEIPAYFGPLKLHGLPGAILEMSDSKMEVFLSTKKISFDSQEALKMPHFDYPIITRKRYTSLSKNELENITKKIASKFGRELKISVNIREIKTLEIDDDTN